MSIKYIKLYEIIIQISQIIKKYWSSKYHIVLGMAQFCEMVRFSTNRFDFIFESIEDKFVTAGGNLLYNLILLQVQIFWF